MPYLSRTKKEAEKNRKGLYKLMSNAVMVKQWKTWEKEFMYNS